MQFATEPHLTWEMIAAALDAGAEAPRVTGDEAYGQDTQLRAALETRRTGYVLAVARSVRARINSGRTPIRTDMVADRLPDAARHRQSVGNGVKGPRYYDRAWIHIGTDEHRHPLIRRNPGTRELAFYLCWSPTAVPLAELVRVAGTRWSVEECFQAAKGEVGLENYQVRKWTAWHRHVTLAMLALAFLTAVAADAPPDRSPEPHHHSRASNLISLTVRENRHLFSVALNPPVVSPARLLYWSNWRRRHQATDRRGHYRRRSAHETSE